MEAKQEKPSASGVNLFTVFFVVFVTLKLAGLVTWSWFFVCSPVWVEIVLWITAVAVLETLKVFQKKD